MGINRATNAASPSIVEACAITCTAFVLARLDRMRLEKPGKYIVLICMNLCKHVPCHNHLIAKYLSISTNRTVFPTLH